MPRINFIAAGCFVIGTLFILLLGLTWQHAERDRIKLETSVTGEQVVLRLRSCFDSRAALINALAAFEWENTAQVLDDWPRRASTLFPLHNGLLGLNFVDPDWIIRSVYPQSSNLAALDADLRQNQFPSVPVALRQAETTGTLHRTDLVELLQSGTGFAFYKLILSTSGTVLGFANGVFRLDDLMESCFAEQPLRNRFTFQLQENRDFVFYQQPDSGYNARSEFEYQQGFDVLGKLWTLSISPSPEYLSQRDRTLPLAIAGLALLFVLAMSVLLRSYMLKQQQLVTREKQYRLLVENQNDMVVEANTNGELQYVSPSYCRTFGKEETALLGTHLLSHVHDDDRATAHEALNNLNTPPHRSYHEQRVMTKDGWRWLAWSNTAVLDAQGNITAITAAARDVTDIRNLEARAAHAEKMQALGNMAGGISHDFNNILHVVRANIEFVMLEYCNDARLQTELQSINQTVERAMSLVARLATLSRQDPVNKEYFDLNLFVKEVAALLQRTLPPTIGLKFQSSLLPLQVKADKSQLEQVMLNICFNARDAIKERGDISIALSSCPLDNAGDLAEPKTDYACIRITDTGSGIPPEILSRIFEPFFTTKQKDRGTGLGLSNCYSIIKQHFGEILVESEPGLGTVFTLYLPLSKNTPKPMQAGKDNNPVSAAPSTRSHSNGSILVVDDDPEILRLTAALLNQAGFGTLTACNGEEALQTIREVPDVALVLMDVLMPVLGGIEAAKELNKLFPALPVLFMSGYIPEANLVPGSKLLKKPFTRVSLLQAVRQLLTPTASLSD